MESSFILGPQTLMYKKTNEEQQMFIEDMMFQIWFKRFILCKCLWVSFPFQVILVDELLPTMVKNTFNLHVLPNLACVTIVFYNFDPWMFKGGVDTFARAIIFLNES